MYWKDLTVWQKAHELVLKAYAFAAKMPDAEKYALCNQLKRYAYSVPANIVEGHSRKTSKEFVQFLFHARGPLEELRYFFLLSRDLKYITHENYNELESESVTINKMLNGLINSVKQIHNS
ncbi:MAG: four helix bundle protein [Nitrospirota bacterium]